MTGTDAISAGMASASTVRRLFIFGTGFVFSFSRCSTRPLDSTSVRQTIKLTRKERQALQFAQPLLIDDHRVELLVLAGRRVPGVVRVRNHIAHVLRVHRVKDGVEVGPVRVAVFWVLVLQVLHHFSVRFELGVDVLDAQLVILGHSDERAFRYRQQRLVSLEDLTHEVAVDGSEGWHIKLD